MGVVINHSVIQEIKEEKKNNLTLQSLGQQLTQEKIKNMQKDSIELKGAVKTEKFPFGEITPKQYKEITDIDFEV